MSRSTGSGSTKLVLIDGNAIMHRAYHALPPLTSKDGEPINAAYGLVSMLIRTISDLAPTHLAVCFDRPEPTFRKIEFEKYQSHRPETAEDLSSQFTKAREILTAMKVKIFEKPGFEADDLIGTLAMGASKSNQIDEVVIITGDRDILQLVDDDKNISVFMPVKGLSEGKLYSEADVKDRLGVKPKNITDYKGFVGDASDNYPGVPGVGPKTAIKLIEEFGSYTKVFENMDKIEKRIAVKLENGKDSGDISYKLAKIVTDVDIQINFSELENWDLVSEDTISIFNKIGFKTLLTRTIKTFGENEKKPRTKKKLSKEDIKRVIVKLAERLDKKRFAIRGTASLKLQDIDMGVDDIDIICDKGTVENFNSEFKKELIKKIEYSESDKYQSLFGQFIFDGILIEVMGEFQYKDSKGNWSESLQGNPEQTNSINVDGFDINVTKPELELDFAAAAGRWNEFHKIKKQIEAKSQESLF